MKKVIFSVEVVDLSCDEEECPLFKLQSYEQDCTLTCLIIQC